jgi:methylenetetrahydrofolate dehydrogenase (NADP+) / methenyltetrahydrofolate cyclohydrolase
MAAIILDGTKISAQIKAEVGEEVKELTAGGLRPGLAVVLAGHNPASEIYVRNKVKACEQLGIYSEKHTPGDDVTTAELLALIDDLNRRDEIDGILVQLPLPHHIDAQRVIAAIDPGKDVDGFHPQNVGQLWSGGKALVPCTPYGCLLLLREAVPALAGADAVVIGRSSIVGKPMAALLLAANCTVTVVHSRSRDIPAALSRADIVVAAVGRPEFVRGAWLKPGSTVIDVGINRIEVPGGKGRLVGDVAFAEAEAVAGAITPVPGGIGPMTIACLLRNTVIAASRRRGRAEPKI